jgi:hypothetical protein
MAAKAYPSQSRQAQLASSVRQRRAWANEGAKLDIHKIRAIDRLRFGGLGPPSATRPRPADGWVLITTLWECQGEAHAPLCNCEAWDAHGQPGAFL